jgi:hypothetical protein
VELAFDFGKMCDIEKKYYFFSISHNISILFPLYLIINEVFNTV